MFDELELAYCEMRARDFRQRATACRDKSMAEVYRSSAREYESKVAALSRGLTSRVDI